VTTEQILAREAEYLGLPCRPIYDHAESWEDSNGTMHERRLVIYDVESGAHTQTRWIVYEDDMPVLAELALDERH
jgi:hypothetical protein